MVTLMVVLWGLGSVMNTMMLVRALRNEKEMEGVPYSMIVAVFCVGLTFSWLVPLYVIVDSLVRTCLIRKRHDKEGLTGEPRLPAGAGGHGDNDRVAGIPQAEEVEDGKDTQDCWKDGTYNIKHVSV